MSINLKTIIIKGKEYVVVNERIKYFRENYPLWSLESEIIQLTEIFCVIKAIIKDENGRVIANGLAREVKTDEQSFINKTSYVENCETSAWGRALANLAIGVDKSIASAEEVANAIRIQENIKNQEKKLETFEDFENAIDSATSVKQLGYYYHKWKDKFDKESFDKLNKKSSDRKLQLENPDLKVEVR